MQMHEPKPYGLDEFQELAPDISSALGNTSTTLSSNEVKHKITAQEKVLWARWFDQRDPHIREQLIMRHLPYVRAVAANLYSSHVHHETEFDEYVQLGTVGMIEALDRFDPTRGAQFKTYAYSRIQGAIRDGLEQTSDRQQQISLRRRLLAERVAAIKNGVPMQKDMSLLERLADIGIGVALTFLLDETGMLMQPEATLPDRCYEPVEILQLRTRMQKLIVKLTPREQSVIRLHYLQGLLFEDIARTLHITRGRVSQLHDQALKRLRKEVTVTDRCDIAL